MFRSASRSMFQALIRTVLVAVALGIGTAHAEEFLSVLDDMPLAPGLTELTDQAADFETPAGRIIDATAQGEVGSATVAAFYDKTLPALGWAREGQGLFVRDHERLTIAITPAARKGWVTAKFSLRPRDAH
jgi:hypothetical protein